MNLKKYTDKFRINVNNIVEIGARDCEETLLLNQMFPKSQITTFECNPVMIPVCEEKVKGFSNIKLIKKAVSDIVGELDFHLLDTQDKGSSSLLVHKTIPHTTVKVPVTTLDAELDFTPDILWLDTQGSELNIFKGAADKLKDVSLIYTEVYFRTSYENQPTYKEIKKYLNSKNFKVAGFSKSWVHFSDAVFVNKKYNPITPQFIVEIKFLIIDAYVHKFKKLFRLIKNKLFI